MKYKATIFLLSFLVLGTARSQDLKMCGYQGYQTVEAVKSACELQGAKSTSESVEDAESKVDAILDKVGLFRNFFIEECKDINNALAVTMPLEGGAIDRYILYDQTFFDKVSTTTGSDWGNVSILAHEVGHHLNGHTLSGTGSTHKVELQADEFSGFVLARMKCSLEDAQSAVSNLLPDEASATHPAKQDRLEAIAKGWGRGSGKKIETKKIIKEVIENKVIVVNEDEVTAEMVLANYLEAIGGQEKVIGVKTLRYKFKVGNVINNLYFETPDKYAKIASDDEGIFAKIITKNKTLFRYDIFGDKIVSRLPINQLNLIDKISYFPEYFNLVNSDGIKYIGIVTMNRIKCYEISLNDLDYISQIEETNYPVKKEFTTYYSVETGLLVAKKEILKFQTGNIDIDKPKIITYYYSDYRSISGILVPFKVTKDTGATTNYLEIEINPTIDPKLFEAPEN